MKINLIEEPPEVVFGDLQPGDVFLWNNDPYVKIYDQKEESNAICLREGSFHEACFLSVDNVIPMYSELTIRPLLAGE